MTRGHRANRSPVPDPLEERLLEWLHEPDTANADLVLERAFAELPRFRRARPRPWDDLVERLRPEPFGRPDVRAAALLLTAALVTLSLVAGVVTGAIRLDLLSSDPVPAPPTPAPTVSASAAPASRAPAVFPLAATGFQIVREDVAGRIFIVDADGANLRQIASDVPAELRSPEWLPGTNRVIVQETTADTDQIWDVDIGGQRRSLVVIPCVEPCLSRNEASPSRDGTRIVFFQAIGPIVDDIPTDCGLAIYELVTQAMTTVTRSPCAIEEERYARFSPDGTRLAFWRSRSPNGERVTEIASSAIFIRDIATGDEQQVTDWSMDASVLDWSPSGEWIVFVVRDWDPATAEGDLWRVRSDGTSLERLTSLDTNGTRVRRPRYTPDGAWILFTIADGSSSRLWAIPADGGDALDVLPDMSVLDYDVRAPDQDGE
jgi:Tol biopolymer transport system component